MPYKAAFKNVGTAVTNEHELTPMARISENRYILKETGQTFANALIIALGIEVKRLTDMAAA
jgi:hypothetical protein